MRDAVVLGVDVGGTKVLVGYVGYDGTVYHSCSYPMDRADRERTLQSIEEAIDTFLHDAWEGLQPLAMGVGLFGQIDPAKGIWVQSVDVPFYTPIRLAERLRERYGYPVRIDNDVKAATLVEMRLGAGKGSADFVYLNVGTGVACGIVCNGELVRGAANYAGELGHTVVELGRTTCPACGRGCLESIASGGGIVARFKALREANGLPWREEDVATAAIFEASCAGDEIANAVVGHAVEALGTALVNLMNLLNPERIILGGGVFRQQWLVDALREYVTRHALPAAAASLQDIAPSCLQHNVVGLLGASELAWQACMD